MKLSKFEKSSRFLRPSVNPPNTPYSPMATSKAMGNSRQKASTALPVPNQRTLLLEVVLLGEFVELGVVGVVELVPGHGGSGC